MQQQIELLQQQLKTQRNQVAESQRQVAEAQRQAAEAQQRASANRNPKIVVEIIYDSERRYFHKHQRESQCMRANILLLKETTMHSVHTLKENI